MITNDENVPFVCHSSTLRAVSDMARRVASSKATILVTGETGAGKEVIARLIHEASGRTGNFVPINCCALPKDLFESELFGHVKGAFSGSIAHKTGLVEEAAGGTLYLDEIGDMATENQAKLLRFLESREYRPLGSTRTQHATCRIVASTNVNIQEQIADGKFRADLLFRLSHFDLYVPPLRERKTDIEHLCQAFINAAKKELGKAEDDIQFEPGVLDMLKVHSWPGNVRELKHLIFRLVMVSVGGSITLEDLQTAGFTREKLSSVYAPPDLARLSVLEKAERSVYQEAMKRFSGNRPAMAEWLGVGRQTVYTKLAYYGLVNGKNKLSEEMEAALDAAEHGGQSTPMVPIMATNGAEHEIESDIPIPSAGRAVAS